MNFFINIFWIVIWKKRVWEYGNDRSDKWLKYRDKIEWEGLGRDG